MGQERKKTHQDVQRQSLITSHRQTNAQPSPEGKTKPNSPNAPCSACLLLHIMLYVQLSSWLVWVNCLVVFTLNSLHSLLCVHCRDRVRSSKVLDAEQTPFSNT